MDAFFVSVSALATQAMRAAHFTVICREDDCGVLQQAEIVAAIKPLGFRFVSLDLEGYRTGALNEVLPLRTRSAAMSPTASRTGKPLE